MLHKSELHFQFPTKYQKVLDHCLALNNTLVFSGIKVTRTYCLTHIDHQKNILGELLFKDDGPDSMVLTSDRDLYALLPEENVILHWDLETHEATRITFNFAVQHIFCSKLFVFPESRTLCVQENGPLGQNTFRLSYLNYPLQKEPEVVQEFKDENGLWSNDHTIITKGNNSSMVCWMKNNFKGAFQFHTYEMGAGAKSYVIENTVGALYGEMNVEINVASMWEMRKNEFCFVCHTSRTIPNENGIINNNYIVDVQSKTVREAKFQFPQQSEHELHIHQMSFGSTAMIRTIAFKAGVALPTPVYYIDNYSEKIVAQETWECSHRNKYHLPGYDGSLLVEALYENGDVDSVTLLPKKVVQGKQVTVFLLNEIMDDCDEDLLYDITSIIDYSA